MLAQSSTTPFQQTCGTSEVNNRNAELIVATITTSFCLLLLSLLATSNTKMELSKGKKKLWLLESAIKQVTRFDDADLNAEDGLVQKTVHPIGSRRAPSEFSSSSRFKLIFEK